MCFPGELLGPLSCSLWNQLSCLSYMRGGGGRLPIPHPGLCTSDKWQGQPSHSSCLWSRFTPYPSPTTLNVSCAELTRQHSLLRARVHTPALMVPGPAFCLPHMVRGKAEEGSSLTQTTARQTSGRASCPTLVPLNQLILKPVPALFPVLPRQGVGPALPSTTAGSKSGASSVQPPEFNMVAGLGLEKDSCRQ